MKRQLSLDIPKLNGLLEKTAKKTNWWIIKQIDPELSLEAQTNKIKLSYFRCIMQKHSSLEKRALILGKEEGKRRRRQPTAEWMDSVMVVISVPLGVLKEQVRDRSLWRKSIHGIIRSHNNLRAHNHSFIQSIKKSIKIKWYKSGQRCIAFQTLSCVWIQTSFASVKDNGVVITL